jgi:hypothetical protein
MMVTASLIRSLRSTVILLHSVQRQAPQITQIRCRCPIGWLEPARRKPYARPEPPRCRSDAPNLVIGVPDAYRVAKCHTSDGRDGLAYRLEARMPPCGAGADYLLHSQGHAVLCAFRSPRCRYSESSVCARGHRTVDHAETVRRGVGRRARIADCSDVASVPTCGHASWLATVVSARDASAEERRGGIIGREEALDGEFRDGYVQR